MVTILDGIAKCPQCSDCRFANPERPRPDTKIVCLSCGHITTIGRAMDAWIAEPQPGLARKIPLLSGDRTDAEQTGRRVAPG
jgi:hypothetical protein